MNGLRNFENSPFLLVIVLVVPFDKIPLFSKDLIASIISFISLFVKFVPAPKGFIILLMPFIELSAVYCIKNFLFIFQNILKFIINKFKHWFQYFN